MTRLAHAVIVCLAGAGLALFGATRVWSVQVTPRPGLPDLRTPATGADLQPWLIALALTALAGAGALLATRGMVRRGLGGLLVLVGVGIAVAAVAGRAGTEAGAAGAGAIVWPIACVLGGALVVLAGLGAARHGHRWPVMGARYERRPVTGPSGGPGAGSGPSPAAGPMPGPRSGTAAGPGAGAVREGGAGTGTAPGRGAASAGGTGAATQGGADPVAGRRGTEGESATEAVAGGSGGATASAGTDEAVDTRAVWDALDRGDDPTAR